MPAAYFLTPEQYAEYQKTGFIPPTVSKVAVDDNMVPLDQKNGHLGSLPADPISLRALAAADKCLTMEDRAQMSQHILELCVEVSKLAGQSTAVVTAIRRKMEACFQVGYAVGVAEALAGRIP